MGIAPSYHVETLKKSTAGLVCYLPLIDRLTIAIERQHKRRKYERKGLKLLILYYSVISLAILVMLGALVLVFKLRKTARGGKIGRVVNLLLGFIVLFLLGYVAGPFLPDLGQEITLILTAVVFLFGAIFVVIVLGVIEKLIKRVFEELGLE